MASIITSPAEAVAKAKYCDEHVCVCLCVCLSVRQDISRTTCTIFTEFFVHVAYPRAQSFSSMFMICRITYCWEGTFFPIDNAL